jgi:pimeloyl-ACP methyl ester carboxylesterase
MRKPPAPRLAKADAPSGWSGVAWWQRLLGLLLMATALAVAMFRAPDRPVQTLVARWAPPPSDFVDVKGQIVHLRDQGPRTDPLPIVLIHGTSASLHTWEGWVRALRTQRRVITFDLPGFGLTGPFAGQYTPDDYHGDQYARFVLDLLDKLQVQRAVLGGNSLGGEVAWRTAAMAPQRVAGLVLVDAVGPDFTPIEVPLAFRIARVPVLNRIGEWFLPRALVVQSVASVYGNPEHITSDLIDRYYELSLRDGNRRACRAWRWATTPSASARSSSPRSSCGVGATGSFHPRWGGSLRSRSVAASWWCLTTWAMCHKKKTPHAVCSPCWRSWASSQRCPEGQAHGAAPLVHEVWGDGARTRPPRPGPAARRPACRARARCGLR